MLHPSSLLSIWIRVSKRLNDKDRQEEGLLAYVGLPLKWRGSCLVGLVVKVEGAESLLTETSGLPQCKIWFWGSEISSSMAITPWMYSGGLREAATEQQHNCGMGRDMPGLFFFFTTSELATEDCIVTLPQLLLHVAWGLKDYFNIQEICLFSFFRELDERLNTTFISSFITSC